MTEAVESAGEIGSKITDRRKALVSAAGQIPSRRTRCVNVSAQRIVQRQATVHALQIGGGGTASYAKRSNDSIVLNRAIRTLLGGEVGGACGEIHNAGCARTDGAGVIQRNSALAEDQRKAGRTRGVHRAVDIDVVLRVQGECIGTPAHSVIDIHITRRARRT